MTVNITVQLVGEGDQKTSERFYYPIGDDVPAEQAYHQVLKLLDDHIDFVIPGTSAD